MKNRLLFLLSACLLIGPVFAQGAGPKTASRPSFAELSTYNASVRNAVLSRWKIPFVERTTTIDVTANIGADGKLVSSDIQISPKIGTSEAVRKSIEEALAANPAFAAPPGAQPYAAEFRLRAQIGPFLADCYPVKVYVPVAHVDQPNEKIVPSSLEGIKQGIAAWNTFISRRDDKLPPALALVEQPEQADVRIDALVGATAFGPYISDEANGQQIVRIVTKFDAGGAVQDGYRWRHPGELKQQTEFQLGRMLGLSPVNDSDKNILFGGPTRSEPKIQTETASTKYVETYYASSFSGHTSGKGSRGHIPNNFSIEKYGGYGTVEPQERLVNPDQVEQVANRIRTHSCKG